MDASPHDVEPVPASHSDPAPASAGTPGASLAKWQFRPGQSGNLAGRPKGLTSEVQRRAGKNGKKLVEGLWLLAYGTPEQRQQHFGEPVHVNTKERLIAISQLLDRGWGRPAALIGLETGPTLLTLLAEVTGRTAASGVTDDDPT